MLFLHSVGLCGVSVPLRLDPGQERRFAQRGALPAPLESPQEYDGSVFGGAGRSKVWKGRVSAPCPILSQCREKIKEDGEDAF